eukprot:15106919-Alexandrium_andersonii.AAC.1
MSQSMTGVPPLQLVPGLAQGRFALRACWGRSIFQMEFRYPSQLQPTSGDSATGASAGMLTFGCA